MTGPIFNLLICENFGGINKGVFRLFFSHMRDLNATFKCCKKGVLLHSNDAKVVIFSHVSHFRDFYLY